MIINQKKVAIPTGDKLILLKFDPNSGGVVFITKLNFGSEEKKIGE